MGGLISDFEAVRTATLPSAQDLVKRNDKLDRDQAAKEQEMTKALEGQKKLKKRLEKAKAACAALEKSVSQREDLVKEEDKRLQEVLDKARRFTKKLLDDEDYRPPADDIKRFKNEDAVLAKINHTEKMKESQLEKRGGKETDPEVARQKMERAQLAYAEKEAGPYLGVPSCRDAFTPSTRLVSISR